MTGWTEVEKAQLFASLIQTHIKSIDWSVVDIPPGRTIKACTHIVQKLKTDAKANMSENNTPNATPNGKVKSNPSTPKSAAKTTLRSGLKRAARPKKSLALNDGFIVDDDEEVEVQETKVRGDKRKRVDSDSEPEYQESDVEEKPQMKKGQQQRVKVEPESDESMDNVLIADEVA